VGSTKSDSVPQYKNKKVAKMGEIYVKNRPFWTFWASNIIYIELLNGFYKTK